ncbi:hypothetical protein DUI87_11449 [Hirundo rustica rustica]|uniref:Thioredoxin-dependent peroxide reductase, mitochondrial n=1 Tax=Hirundo rustica rustica TaxID=333673 RepID=A0A3M0KJZ2_HIRRU|nr:hypothetical protein DUI87_11449 [Hirundo rustica rustica]
MVSLLGCLVQGQELAFEYHCVFLPTEIILWYCNYNPSSSRFAAAVTQHAPHFKGTAVVNGEFKELSLDDFKGKYLVLFFYPLDFTFVCPTEIVAFSDKAKEFRDVNCEVVAVSVDSHFSHLAWINTPRKSGGLGKMNIPVLSDLTKQISRDYGVLLEGPGIALRGLFIIDPNGVIKHLSVNDLPVGRSVEETLRLVKAFQFVEAHGEVCPANWTPNSPTTKQAFLLSLVIISSVQHQAKHSFFSQFVFHTYTTAFTLVNGNGTPRAEALPLTYMNRYALKSSLMQLVVRKLLPAPLFGLTSAFTVVMVRSPEFDNGIEVMDRNGKVIGVSKKAGEKIKRADLEPEILSSTEETEFFYNRGI